MLSAKQKGLNLFTHMKRNDPNRTIEESMTSFLKVSVAISS